MGMGSYGQRIDLSQIESTDCRSLPCKRMGAIETDLWKI